MVDQVDTEIKNVFISQSIAIEQNILQMILNWDMQLVKLNNIVHYTLNSTDFDD